jgi:hypothetical protein
MQTLRWTEERGSRLARGGFVAGRFVVTIRVELKGADTGTSAVHRYREPGMTFAISSEMVFAAPFCD